MSKGKRPRKRHDPEPERRTEERFDLVPPHEPDPRPAPLERARPALFQLVQGMRTAIGAMLDIADAAAEVIARQLQRRA